MPIPIPTDDSPRFKAGTLYVIDGYDAEHIRNVLLKLYAMHQLSFAEQRALALQLERALDNCSLRMEKS